MNQIGAAVRQDIYVDGPDGQPVKIGTLNIPLHLTANPLPAGTDATVRLDVGEVKVRVGEPHATVDLPDHDGCPEDLTLCAYVAAGDASINVGELTCCD